MFTGVITLSRGHAFLKDGGKCQVWPWEIAICQRRIHLTVELFNVECQHFVGPAGDRQMDAVVYVLEPVNECTKTVLFVTFIIRAFPR